MTCLLSVDFGVQIPGIPFFSESEFVKFRFDMYPFSGHGREIHLCVSDIFPLKQIHAAIHLVPCPECRIKCLMLLVTRTGVSILTPIRNGISDGPEDALRTGLGPHP